MASITFKGNTTNTSGNLPVVGDKAPDFLLVAGDLSEVSLKDFIGKKVIFNIFPSIDTPVCANQLKTFADKASALDNTALLFSSMDLPFAFGRFCAAENIDNAVTTSDFRHQSLATAYGVKMIDGPLNGLYARAVIILDENHHVIYSELVTEVTEEPNYEAAMATLAV